MSTSQPNGPRRANWAGNYEYDAVRLHVPGSVQEAMELVHSDVEVKALGTRHSFSEIADSRGTHISLERLDAMMLDAQSGSVTIGAGVTYGRLCPWLAERGYALHNLASLPHISVVGACVTATHGSGLKNGNLSTAVSALEFITAEGTLESLSSEKNPDIFAGAVVNLGALGIITSLTLRVEPAFTVSQAVYENLPFAQLDSRLEEIFSSAYSISLFTGWQNGCADQVWMKRKVNIGDIEPPQDFFGATLAHANLHPLPRHEAENCTEQQCIPGPWHERLPHFRMNFTPSSGQELQSEYFVPFNDGAAAIRAVQRLSEQIAPHLLVSEIRAVAGDNLWLSPCYRRPSLAIHFTWKPDWPAVRPLLAEIESALATFAPRPHWAKLFTMSSSVVQAQYQRLPEFRDVLRRYDPDGKFRNGFLRTHLY